jgi:hypothetical protein
VLDQADKIMIGQRFHKTNKVIPIHVTKDGRCFGTLHQVKESELIWDLQEPESRGHLPGVMFRYNLRGLDVLLSPESPSHLLSQPP